jgi:glycolate oxidase FAD binding subunit
MSDLVITRYRDQILDAAQNKIKIRITGSGSKDWYGGRLQGEPLSTLEYCGVINYQPDELVITVKAGTPLSEVEATLNDKNQQFAFDPPYFGPNATIGGMVCAGLAGPGRISAGSLRDFVLGAKIMDGKGQILNFGGTVMKNVAGYDIARLMPGSLGTLALLLEVSIKVLPKPAASATVSVPLEQQAAINVMNLLASQPWPINASAWVDHTLYLRLCGAKAAVKNAIESFDSQRGMKVVEQTTADEFWKSLREQTHPWFDQATQNNLWRLSLPTTSPRFDASDDTLIEWHGGQRWIKGANDAATLKSMALAKQGHASLFKGNNKAPQMLSSLSDNPLTQGLVIVQQRLQEAFDPSGVFATERLI